MSLKMMISLHTHLTDKEIEAFGLWAFGEDYKQYISGVRFLEEWNKRKGHLLLLNSKSEMVEDLKLMVKLYEQQCSRISE